MCEIHDSTTTVVANLIFLANLSTPGPHNTAPRVKFHFHLLSSLFH